MTGLERHMGVLELAAQMLAGDRLLCYRPIHTASPSWAPADPYGFFERSTSEPAAPSAPSDKRDRLYRRLVSAKITENPRFPNSDPVPPAGPFPFRLSVSPRRL